MLFQCFELLMAVIFVFFIPAWGFYMFILTILPVVCWVHYRMRMVDEDNDDMILSSYERAAGYTIRKRLANTYLVCVIISVFFGLIASMALEGEFWGNRCVGLQCKHWHMNFAISVILSFPVQCHIFWMMNCYADRLLPLSEFIQTQEIKVETIGNFATPEPDRSGDFNLKIHRACIQNEDLAMQIAHKKVPEMQFKVVAKDLKFDQETFEAGTMFPEWEKQMYFELNDGDKLLELELFVNGQFYASYKVLPTFFLGKNLAGGHYSHCQASDCGSKYAEDAKFCRKCGVKRLYDPNQIEVELTRDGF